MMQKTAELISNGLSIPVLVMCALVVILWARGVYDAMRIKFNGSQSWFIIGVFFGFAGEFIDNLYWLVAWTASYLELDMTEKLVSVGVYSNIPFRQLLTIFAAYCHCKSALEWQKSKAETIFQERKLNDILIFSILYGFVFGAILFLFKR